MTNSTGLFSDMGNRKGIIYETYEHFDAKMQLRVSRSEEKRARLHRDEDFQPAN